MASPEIARRANVSNQTFYDIYSSKHEAFLGAQKVGMHQALRIAVEAYEAQGEDWPRAIDAGVRALLEYLASEPAHAHLSLVDTFAACPDARSTVRPPSTSVPPAPPSAAPPLIVTTPVPPPSVPPVHVSSPLTVRSFVPLTAVAFPDRVNFSIVTGTSSVTAPLAIAASNVLPPRLPSLGAAAPGDHFVASDQLPAPPA